jgi:hypothetical protein
LKQTLRTALLLAFAIPAVAAFSGVAQAQKLDIALGVSTVDAPGASSANGVDHQPVSLTGGAYPGFSADVLFFHNLGFGGEFYWKASKRNYDGDPTLPIRPTFFAFNAVYSPKLASHAYLELVAGIGALDTRIYCSSCVNPFTGTNYVTDKHFLGDFGGGIKLYAAHNFFVRPEARFYLVNNNLNFSSARFARYGVSIGYTLR